MILPKLIDHNNGVGFEAWERKTYIDRYIEAKNAELEARFNAGRLSARLSLPYEQAVLAFKFVNARFRLTDISGSVRSHNLNSIQAQTAEVDALQKRVSRVSSGFLAFHETIAFFTENAKVARQADSDELNHIAMGRAGMAGDIVVTEDSVTPLSWMIPDINPPDFVFDQPLSKQQKWDRDSYTPNIGQPAPVIRGSHYILPPKN